MKLLIYSLVAILFYVTIYAGITWVSVSLIVSGAKAGFHSCDETYKIERYLEANWFCPDKSERE